MSTIRGWSWTSSLRNILSVCVLFILGVFDCPLTVTSCRVRQYLVARRPSYQPLWAFKFSSIHRLYRSLLMTPMPFRYHLVLLSVSFLFRLSLLRSLWIRFMSVNVVHEGRFDSCTQRQLHTKAGIYANYIIQTITALQKRQAEHVRVRSAMLEPWT